MTPRVRVAVWTAALIVIAFGGSRLCAALVRFAHSPAGVDGPYSFAAGMRLPVGVVNDAQGALPVFLGSLAVFALLALCGWRLACELRDDTSLPDAAILVVQAVGGIALTFFAITFSSDPYAYVIFARTHGIFRLNPYIFLSQIGIIQDHVLHQCIAFYGDPPPSDNYGPLWTIVAGLVGRAESTSTLWLQVWTQRIAALAGAVACTGGVLRLLASASPATRRFGAALFAFHPLVLWESAVGGHNDFLMLAFAIWAIALVDAYPIVSGALLGAAIGIKYLPLLIVPVLVARATRSSGVVRGLACGAMALAIPVIGFLPFWDDGAALRSLVNHSATLGLSPLWLLYTPLAASGFVDSAVAPGWHGSILAEYSWGRLLQFLIALGVAALVIVTSIRIARGASIASVWRIVTATLWGLPSVNVWYVAWLMPAVAFGGRWATYAWWFGALALLHYAADTGVITYSPAPFALAALAIIIYIGAPVLIALRARSPATASEQAPAG